jgi:hypothetical protein
MRPPKTKTYVQFNPIPSEALVGENGKNPQLVCLVLHWLASWLASWLVTIESWRCIQIGLTAIETKLMCFFTDGSKYICTYDRFKS